MSEDTKRKRYYVGAVMTRRKTHVIYDGEPQRVDGWEPEDGFPAVAEVYGLPEAHDIAAALNLAAKSGVCVRCGKLKEEEYREKCFACLREDGWRSSSESYEKMWRGLREWITGEFPSASQEMRGAYSLVLHEMEKADGGQP